MAEGKTSNDALKILTRITTVSEMTEAFRDEDRCRRLLETLVWPRGRICPACGYRRSTSIAGRDRGRTKRPGLYQCSNRACHHQFTVTTRRPLHSTKLPLRLWLQGLWLILQSDKGLSSVRLGEALGISQQAAWRMGHALRLLLRQEPPLDGIVEIDDLWLGGLPRKPAGDLGPGPGRGRKGPGPPRRRCWRWSRGLRTGASAARPDRCGPAPAKQSPRPRPPGS